MIAGQLAHPVNLLYIANTFINVFMNVVFMMDPCGLLDSFHVEHIAEHVDFFLTNFFFSFVSGKLNGLTRRSFAYSQASSVTIYSS